MHNDPEQRFGRARWARLARFLTSSALAFCVLALATGAGGCSSSEPEAGTGKTHFLTPCTDDAECRSASPSSICRGGKCTDPVASDDFSSCEKTPPSVCTRAETCGRLGCGGFEFDEHGCARRICGADADCGDPERCTAIQCVNQASCSYDFGPDCVCGGNGACVSGAFCNPVSVVGARGDWVSLEVRHGPGFCAPPESCTFSWTIAADGGISASKAGQPISTKMSERDLAALRNIVNGPDLRPALRDGIQCGNVHVSDALVEITLSLSGGITLQREVTDCVLGPPEGSNLFQQVDAIAKRY